MYTYVSSKESYDSELAELHSLFETKLVRPLLVDSVTHPFSSSSPSSPPYIKAFISLTKGNDVKRMLVSSGISKLCVFFGREKANDVLLSHLITFQNDKVH